MRMNETISDPAAIAELLWHRFELQDGRALAVVLDPNGRNGSRSALRCWVRRRLSHYADCRVTYPLLEIERDLASLLMHSGLRGGELDLSGPLTGNAVAEEGDSSHQNRQHLKPTDYAADGTSSKTAIANNVISIDFGGRHD